MNPTIFPQRPSATPRITARNRTRLSPWVTIVERLVEFGDGAGPQTYHALELADYVTVFAVTTDGGVPLVRQFRPTIEDWSLELPGGMLDPGEDPAEAACRELAEESGLACEELQPLGCFDPDTGRLGNKAWGFFAKGATRIPGWQPEAHVSAIEQPLASVLDDVAAGRFTHLLHVGFIGIAMARRLVPLPSSIGGIS